MTLGQRIQQLRVSSGYSQEELAERLGTTRQAISKWELDQAIPEVGKVVHLSKLFSVTTDSLLVDGITTFDIKTERFHCGIYRSGNCEIVETERFSYVVSSSNDGKLLSAKLYTGLQDKKHLCAVCERDKTNKLTRYAYAFDEKVISNDSDAAAMIGEEYDSAKKKSMKRLESFYVDHSGVSMPKVSESGIKACLLSWRMRTQFKVSEYELLFTLCTEKTEYVCHINPTNHTNIYCGASNNTVFDMGLMNGGQYFRIRNYKDNTEPFCQFYSDFSYKPSQRSNAFDIGMKSAQAFADENQIWMVKRYSDDEIVLQGCGDDEYFYHRQNDGTAEVLCAE